MEIKLIKQESRLIYDLLNCKVGGCFLEEESKKYVIEHLLAAVDLGEYTNNLIKDLDDEAVAILKKIELNINEAKLEHKKIVENELKRINEDIKLRRNINYEKVIKEILNYFNLKEDFVETVYIANTDLYRMKNESEYIKLEERNVIIYANIKRLDRFKIEFTKYILNRILKDEKFDCKDNIIEEFARIYVEYINENKRIITKSKIECKLDDLEKNEYYINKDYYERKYNLKTYKELKNGAEVIYNIEKESDFAERIIWILKEYSGGKFKKYFLKNLDKLLVNRNVS